MDRIHRDHRRAARAIDSAAATLALLLTCAGGARAATPFGGGGYDYYEGPDRQITRSALAIGGVTGTAGVGALTVMRFDDSGAGEGFGATGMLGAPLGAGSSLRLWGSRWVGDGPFKAWRIRTGPQFSGPGGATLGLFYTHHADNLGQRSDGGSAEIEAPLIATLTGRGSAGLASMTGARTGWNGSVGLGWRAVPGLELGGDFGIGRNLAQATSPAPQPVLPLPLLGGSPGGTTSTEARSRPWFQLGARVLWP